MHNLIIQASPRPKGTSAMLAGLCHRHFTQHGDTTSILPLYAYLKNLPGILEAVAVADTILFIGPSYINTYPADTFWLLEQLQIHAEVQHGQRIYGIIQGGMPYAHTHKSGLEALRLFCDTCGFVYGGGFVIGLGALLNGQTLEKLPNGKKTAKYFDCFLDHIVRQENAPSRLYEKAQMKIPGPLARLLAKRMNQSIRQNLIKNGIDPQQKNPYLSGT